MAEAQTYRINRATLQVTPCRVPSSGLRYALVHKDCQRGRVVKVTRSIVFGKSHTVEGQAALLGRIVRKGRSQICHDWENERIQQ
jgi:hypothetical protein